MNGHGAEETTRSGGGPEAAWSTNGGDSYDVGRPSSIASGNGRGEFMEQKGMEGG
jgi:hypothetical protein